MRLEAGQAPGLLARAWLDEPVRDSTDGLVLAEQHASQFVKVSVGRRGIWQTVAATDLCNACVRA